jgi:predicted nucleic acid-binding Zn ribbon protein
MPGPPDESEAYRKEWQTFAQRRAAEQRGFHGRKPRQIGSVFAELVSQRGYARVQATSEREAAWRALVGPELAALTEVAALRRGTLEVLVAHSLLMQELVFRKEELLAGLQAALPDAGVKQLRFQLGKTGA